MESTSSYRPPLNRRAANAQGNGTNKIGRCPYLGTSVDPGTALAFASDANHCYRTRLPVPISSIHQENYCLAAHYEGCPVYRQNLHLPELVPLAAVAFSVDPVSEPPIDRLAPAYDAPVVTEVTVGRPPRLGLRSIVAGLLLLGLVIGAWWVWRDLLSERADGAQTAVSEVPGEGLAAVATGDEPLPTDEPPLPPTTEAAVGIGAAAGDVGAVAESLSTATPVPTATFAAPTVETPVEQVTVVTESALPTALPLPTVTATAVLLSGACLTPDWWVPYVVQTGETLAGLAFTRGVPLREVMAANCLETIAVASGSTVWLPPVAVVTFPGADVGLPLPPPSVGGLPIVTPGPVGPTPTGQPGVGRPGLRPTSEAPSTPRPPQPTSVAPPTATPPFFSTATPPVLPTATPPAFPEVTKTPPGDGPPTSVPPTSTPPSP